MSDPDFSGNTSKLWPEIDHLEIKDLLLLRSQIDQRLPATALGDLDLEKELVIQFQHVKNVMQECLEDSETPANQKSQVINSCASLLNQMTKNQTELYSAERLKRLEQSLIEALSSFDSKMCEKFLDIYQELYLKSNSR